MSEYCKFLVEKEYVESFTSHGKSVPPFLVFQPYAVRDGIPGYMIPCKPDDPDAELWDDKAEAEKREAKFRNDNARRMD